MFVRALKTVMRHEGGLADNPSDPGGLTKYGISQRSYPNLDIAALTREQAAEIYYRDWWRRYGYGRLPDTIAVKLMDLAVAAPAPAHRSLQRAVRANGIKGLDDDGVLGPLTVAAVARCNPPSLLAALRSEFAGYCRLVAERHLAESGKPDLFLAGWLARAYA